MAFERAPEYGDTWRFSIQKEGTYGTALTEGPMNELNCEPIPVDRGAKITKVKSSKGSKNPILAERAQSFSGSTASYTLTMPMNAYGSDAAHTSLYILLASHCQYVSSNVFSFFDDHPAGDGVDHSHTLFCKSPVAGEDRTFAGGVGKTLSFSFEPDVVTIATDVECKNEGLISQTQSTTLQQSGSHAQAPSLLDFTYTLDVNGTGASNVSLENAHINLAWDAVEKRTSDGDGGYADKSFHGREACTFDFTIVYATQAELIQDAIAAGQTVKLTITPGTDYAAAANFTDLWCIGCVDTVEDVFDGIHKLTVTCTMVAETESTNFCEVDMN